MYLLLLKHSTKGLMGFLHLLAYSSQLSQSQKAWKIRDFPKRWGSVLINSSPSRWESVIVLQEVRNGSCCQANQGVQVPPRPELWGTREGRRNSTSNLSGKAGGFSASLGEIGWRKTRDLTKKGPYSEATNSIGREATYYYTYYYVWEQRIAFNHCLLGLNHCVMFWPLILPHSACYQGDWGPGKARLRGCQLSMAHPKIRDSISKFSLRVLIVPLGRQW